MKFDNLFEKPIRLCEGAGDAVTSGCWMAAANLLLGRRNYDQPIPIANPQYCYDNPVAGSDGVICDLDKPPEIPCEIGSFCISVNDTFTNDQARSAAIGPYIMAPVLVEHHRVTRSHIVSALKRLKTLLRTLDENEESHWDQIASSNGLSRSWAGNFPEALKDEIDDAISEVVTSKMSKYRRLWLKREARSKAFFNFLASYIVDECDDEQLTCLVQIVAEEIFEKQSPKEDFKPRPSDIKYVEKALARTGR